MIVPRNAFLHRVLLTAGVSLLLAAQSVAAAEVAGVKVADSVRILNQDLVLNGAGVRVKGGIFKVFVGALYLPGSRNTMEAVFKTPGPKRLSLFLLRDVESDEFARGFMNGIRENTTKEERVKIISQMGTFGEIFAKSPPFQKGDVITVDWIPGSGTLLQLNGKDLARPIPDIAFYEAVMKIWLGEKAIDQPLKRLLLGVRE